MLCSAAFRKVLNDIPQKQALQATYLDALNWARIFVSSGKRVTPHSSWRSTIRFFLEVIPAFGMSLMACFSMIQKLF